MDDVHQYTSFTYQLKLINTCRLYLQVSLLSEVANLEGDSIIPLEINMIYLQVKSSGLIRVNQTKKHGKFKRLYF